MTEDVKRYIQAARLTASEMDDTLTTTDVHDLLDAVEVGRDRLFEMSDLIEQLTAELEQVTRERDAAVSDLQKADVDCAFCDHMTSPPYDNLRTYSGVHTIDPWKIPRVCSNCGGFPLRGGRGDSAAGYPYVLSKYCPHCGYKMIRRDRDGRE